jgi:mevalonate kinase
VSKQTTYKSNGKLLITGEYVVLDGATALAIPTKYGQSLAVTDNNEQTLHWVSKDHTGNIWFETHIDLTTLSCSNESKIAKTLCTILQTARAHNTSFLKKK